ncbi:hypothetical protein [Billgrantia desiderata]|uniref:hypothetical protein n=1 Tax=Billgrantia desiderata TaxID=52021 RepID=UPI00089E66A5|nr:hypothetical protein [Halomonas desiderata]SEG30042.1 integrating conjugative element protein, PFL_4711 family [Halomonas desiderata]
MSRAFRVSRALIAAAVLAASTHASAQSAGDALYYQIGGASPFSVSAGRGHNPFSQGIGIRWNSNMTCGNFDIGTTVSNQLNGLTRGFQNLMGDVINNAQSAVMSMPAMIIKRSNPDLYDMMNNGVLQASASFDRSRVSCQQLSEQMADVVMGDAFRRQSLAMAWQDAAGGTRDAVAAEEQAESRSGDAGVTWVGGERRGGAGQAPIRVVEDAARAGYNLLHGRSDPGSRQPIAGGGGGWGAAGARNGNGTGDGGGGSGASGCAGGMCSVWASPDDAVGWVQTVIGELEYQTCDDCEQSRGQAGTGLARELEEEYAELHEQLVALVNGTTAPTAEALAEVSAGDGFGISRGVIESLQRDPQRDLLTHRLASEMAMARTISKALWGRRLMLAGASEPGIAGNEKGVAAIDRKVSDLDREIEALRYEFELRHQLADSAVGSTLRREASRRSSSQAETVRPGSSLLEREFIGGDE